MKSIVIFRTLILSVFLVIFTLLYNPTISQAKTIQRENDKAVTSETKSNGPTDPKEMEAFLDKFFTEKMDKLHIPGLAFVLVKDGEIFFTKGFNDAFV